MVQQDLAHCSRLTMDPLLRHPSVEDSKTGFVFDQVKKASELVNI